MNIDDDFEEDFEKGFKEGFKGFKGTTNNNDSKNRIALIISRYATVNLILGIIAALIGLIVIFEKVEIGVILIFSGLIIGFISWLMLRGFAEIIQILHDIRRNQEK